MKRERMENLRRVARILPIDRLDMGNWDICLAGWAAKDYYFRDKGLRPGFTHLASFFDISEGAADYLFMASNYKSVVSREDLLDHIDNVMAVSS